MIAIDVDKLLALCRMLSIFENSITDTSTKVKKEVLNCNFTPVEMMSCLSMGKLEDDERQFIKSSEKLIKDVSSLINFVNGEVLRYSGLENKLNGSASRLGCTSLGIGMPGNENISSTNEAAFLIGNGAGALCEDGDEDLDELLKDIDKETKEADELSKEIDEFTDNDDDDDWESKPAKKDIFDKLVDFITGDYSEKTQLQEVLDAQYMGMQWDSYNCAQDVSINAETGFRGIGALDAMAEELESTAETPTLSSKISVTGPKSVLPEVEVNEGGAEVEWEMPVGGGHINGRRYSQHAMERMAPNTPEVKAELYKRATKLAQEKGLVPQTKEYSTFVDKYVDPRDIPPSVIEDTIKNAKFIPGNRPGTFLYETESVKVVVNENGDVITVIPK